MYTRVISIVAIVIALTIIGGCKGSDSRQSSQKESVSPSTRSDNTISPQPAMPPPSERESVSPSTRSTDKSVSKQYRVVMWDANLYAEADSRSSAIGRVKQGERLEILKRKDLTFKNITVPWFYVKTGTGKTGWIGDASLEE